MNGKVKMLNNSVVAARLDVKVVVLLANPPRELPTTGGKVIFPAGDVSRR
jgi:hypothetical protein